MEKIKIRVWDKEEKKFLIPCFEKEEDRFNKGMAMIRWNSEGKVWFTLSGYRDGDGNPYQIDAEILQDTGLRDKNDKDIYSGYIVKIPDNATYSYGVVAYSDNYASYVFKSTNSIKFEDENIGDYSGIEVIGNIYENPELLIK